MNKFIISLLSLVGVWFLPLKTSAQQFKAGAAKVSITPPIGTSMNGGFMPVKAEKIHDSLYAKAVVVDDGKVKAAFVFVDICVASDETYNAAKMITEKKAGIPFENIMIASTHTHSAGSIQNLYFCEADTAYRNTLPPKIAESVIKASGQLNPAKVSWGGVDFPQYVSCRRWYMKKEFVSVNPFGSRDVVKMNPPEGSEFLDKPAGPIDPQVGFMAIKGLDDSWIAVVANYSMHYVGDVEPNTISADYFGEFGVQLQHKLQAGPEFIGIMSNGTSGNTNSMDFKNPSRYPKEYYAKTKLIAGDIATAIMASLAKAEWDFTPEVKTAHQNLEVKTRKPGLKDLEYAKANLDENSSQAVKSKQNDYTKLYAREQILLNEYPDKVHLPLQAIKIGEGIIGALPGEFFTETGLALKKNSPAKNYFTICLANGWFGYVAPPEQHKLGGYETWRSRTSYLEIGAEPKIKNTLLNLLKKLN
jgi:hypothetical protein